MTIRHVKSPIVDGYTLCHVTHEKGEPARMVQHLERVNCPACRVVMNYIRKEFTGYDYRSKEFDSEVCPMCDEPSCNCADELSGDMSDPLPAESGVTRY